MRGRGADGERRRRPWWILAVAYAVTVVVYVALTLPGTSTGHASQQSRAEVQLAAIGDARGDVTSERLLKGVGEARPDFFLPLGNLSSLGPGSGTSLCGLLGKTKVPVQLVAGQADRSAGQGTSAGELAQCRPDRKQAEGNSPAQYYFDEGSLLRIVVISPDLDVGGRSYTYGPGSDEERWLRGVLDDARRARIRWVVVAMHKPCIRVGGYSCDIQGELLNLLVDYRVDLVLLNHSYQRTVQLAHSPLCREVPVGEGTSNPECIVAAGADQKYRAGLGSVVVVVGPGAGRSSPPSPAEGDAPLVVPGIGATLEPANGFLGLAVRADSIQGRFVKTSGAGELGDHFEIQR